MRPGKRAVLLLIIAVLLVGSGVYHRLQPLPSGIAEDWPVRPLQDPLLLTDRTWHDEAGRGQLDHAIFDEVLRLIGQARQLIVVDMFLFNDSGPPGPSYRPLASQLTDALLARKRAAEGITIVVITDSFNTLYGGIRSPLFEQLRAAGIPVVETPLAPLRDSNPLWSTVWRLCCQSLGNDADGGWLPNPIGRDKTTLRSFLALLNFKANHRKTLIVDEGDSLRAVVTSANPHDGSSRHSNVALAFSGAATADLLHTELAVLAMAGVSLQLPAFAETPGSEPDGQRTQILTEGRILDAALAMIDTAPAGSELDLAMFYFSHRDLIRAFIAAQQRGVRLRILLDANHDAFGREKNGIPNRQVAMELHHAGIDVRWCNTDGEQCHSKLLMRRDADRSWQFMLGSANFTRRNLDNFNLETNIWVGGTGDTPLSRELSAHFDERWHQPSLSLPYQAWQDESRLRYWRYRAMEALGLSTF